MTTRGRGSEAEPKFFPGLQAFTDWLALHHADRDDLWVGLHKRAAGKATLTYKEAVDAALCYGWIDGIRKSRDEESYQIRFTPRRKGSIWSAVNLKRVTELIELGRMAPSGLKTYRTRDPRKQNIYSFENRTRTLPPRYMAMFRADKDALAYYRDQPWWYRRTTTWWVVSAKQEETRLRRLKTLIDHCGKKTWIGALRRPTRPAKRGE
jgi:uncharacterized protein YdeI (YjbR/CyaY-like superfamily)